MGGIAWTEEEDYLLKKCIEQFGEGKWHRVPQLAGLKRCRKSCRLRWLNYLHPNIRRGSFTEEEIELIVQLHRLFGNRWSLIAGRLPGRTANDVKNYWNCHLSKKMSAQGVAEKANSMEEESPSSSSYRKIAATSKQPAILGAVPDREPPQEENGRLKGVENAANQYGKNREMIQHQAQEYNQNLPIEKQSIVSLSNLQTDFQFDQENRVTEDEDGCNEWELWNDWTSDVDLWINSL